MPNTTPLFAERYRIQSSRMPKWDYAGYGSYFITICTDERRPWFGHIRNGIMCLSDAGSVVEQFWSAIPDHFPHVHIGTHIVMPDHIHWIMTIHSRMTDTNAMPVLVETFESNVSTGNKPAIDNPHIFKRPSPGSLGTIIGQFKSVFTKRIRATGYPDFMWQPRFHDRVIRSRDDMNHFRRYILNNPAAWSEKHARD